MRHIRLSAILLVFTAACSETTSAPPGPTGDAGTPPPVTCPVPTGAGTEHARIEGSETWTFETSPHRITTGLTVAEGTTLAIEPCAIVELAERTGVLVLGTLDARGEEGRPVAFRPREAGKRWSNIEVRNGSLKLAYTTVEGGGALGNGRPAQVAMIDVRGDQELAAQPIFDARHVRIVDSESTGVWLREGDGFSPESTDVTITGGQYFPINVWGRALRTLPAIAHFAGNANDAVLVPGSGGRDDIKEDTTIRKLDVPYQIGSDESFGMVRVEAPSVPLLTIEAGVELRFVENGVLTVSSGTSTSAASGALVVKGTAEQPVVFTSSAPTPAAGDWTGIWLGGSADPRTSIDHAVVRYAGGRSGANSFGCPSPLEPSFSNSAGILLLGGGPSRAFVTNTTIQDCAGDGIVRGWTGEPIDFLPTNTFTNVARCQQTFPKPTNAVCPSPAPCPR